MDRDRIKCSAMRFHCSIFVRRRPRLPNVDWHSWNISYIYMWKWNRMTLDTRWTCFRPESTWPMIPSCWYTCSTKLPPNQKELHIPRHAWDWTSRSSVPANQRPDTQHPIYGQVRPRSGGRGRIYTHCRPPMSTTPPGGTRWCLQRVMVKQVKVKYLIRHG
jgi:hypothetical protein